MASLAELMTSHGSDKGSGDHNYTSVYEKILNHLVGKEDVNIFELGIGTNNPNLPSTMGVNGVPGASLRGWRDWFGKANIYAGDIDKNILFTEEKIKTFYVDQRSPESIKELWSNIDEIFDVIIDDGLHELNANYTFISNSHNKLKMGGYFIVEDLWMGSPDAVKGVELFAQACTGWFSDTKLYRLPHEYNRTNNNILVCRK